MGLTAVSAGASWLLPGCAEPARTSALPKYRPNIIFILADDLGYGDLGCYGQKAIKTPNIDKLAAEGMRFTDHYAGSTVCAPSRCCLMTGFHTGHALIRGNADVPLRPSDVTVAELLKEAGYSTGIIGKWGLGEADSTGIPNRQGFDYWFGYLNQRHAHNYYPEYLWLNENKFELKNEVNHVIGGQDRTPGGVATRRDVYSHDLFAEQALSFVEKNKDNPFFLYLALTIPHANNEAGNKGMEVPSLEPYADMDWPEPQKGHAAMITRMDGDIGRLMAKLKELGIDDNTLVIFTSDNGPHKEGGGDQEFFDSSGPLKGYKRALYEGGIRVPMIARWPDRIKAGSVSNHVSAFWDFLPTCCELVGVKSPQGIDGISMVPTLLGRPGEQREHEFLYWEFHEQGKRQAVRMGDWKGVRQDVAENPNGPVELYNLKNDIGEKSNVAVRHPGIVAKIEAYMKAARTPSEHWPLPGQ
ncbi:MAG: N-acetylgalactosamine-6-sulfatase [Planctomycetes bacterium RBG_13_50_24]|nr:MAG: N-acetylgalactosamine-6-sulfatase [Planctomycetes bacterium RBG_13_50_24]